MSARARSSVLRTAERSWEARPTASLRAASDISTVGVVLSSMRRCGFNTRAAAAPRLFQRQRRLVRRLIQPELAATRQADRRPHAPDLALDLGARDLLRGERRDGGLQVVAHQVDSGVEHAMAGVLRA